MGADPQQTLTAFREAEAYDGPSLVLAYCHCIAHGIEMRHGLDQQYRGRGERLLAAGPLRPGGARGRRQPVHARLARGRGFRSATTRTGNCATARSPTPIRPRPNGCSGSAEQAVERAWDVYEEMATRGAQHFPADARKERLMDLSTRYMGLALRNPLVASASPLSWTVDGVRRLADAGVGAVVLYSLFEEQVRREAAENARLVEAGSESFAESLSYFPDVDGGRTGPAPLPERARAGRRRRRDPGDREPQRRHARRLGRTTRAAMQDAGAAAIELNIYYLPGEHA